MKTSKLASDQLKGAGPIVREIAGKTVRDTLDDLLERAQCALVVIDMQRGACETGGALGRAGQRVDRVAAIAPRCGELIAAARVAGVRVVHVRVANLPGGASSSPAWLRSLERFGGVDPANLSIEGTWETEFCDDCAPLESETVITKRRASAFIGTELALLLRSSGIETVVVAGTATAGCVEATIRDASHRDFYTVLVEDCVAMNDPELHAAALTIMRARYECCVADDVRAAWSSETAHI